MIESYQQEIIRKRRASRFFWMIVFLFAGFLYFFFQGYYPSMDFSLREIFSTWWMRRPEMNEIIKSFGIINVGVKQKNATLLLSSGSYVSDEKRMTNYGSYSLSITKDIYIPDRVDFTIDKETPYYIDIVSLLPRPLYSRFGTGISNIANIGNNEWTAHTSSGLLLMDKSLSGGILISSWVLTHIGEWYFLSGKSLLKYDGEWIRKTWIGSNIFITNCSGIVSMRQWKLYCEKDGKVLVEKGNTLTGVLSIGTNYIKTKTSLLVWSNLSPISFSGSEGKSSNYIEKDGTWYSQSGWVFRALEKNRSTNNPFTINTGLDEIRYSSWNDGDLIVIGKKWNDHFLTILSGTWKKQQKFIPFPNIPLEEVRIEKINGNLFFKTHNALLFLYHNSEKIEWLIDGEILAFGTESALYKKDSIVWRADWSEEN